MNRQQFRQWTEEKILFLDGATGSNLMKAGMPAGVCPEAWIMEHEDVLVDLQKRYVEAGSNIVYAPTFTANRIKLEEYGLADKIEEINQRLVAASKRAVEGKAYVAGDLTMTGRQLKPIGNLEFEELVDVYKEQIRLLADAGADLLVIETMMSLQECRAALIAAKEVCDLPVMVTLTFENGGRTLFGSDAMSAAITLESLGADAIGANCSTGPAKMRQVIETMARVTSIPIIAKPNAGLPAVDGEGNTYYDMDAKTFAQEMQILIEAGATILGGCCGTSPEYINELTETVNKNDQLSQWHASRRLPEHKQGRRFLCSERQALEFGLNDRFMIVGERINPTGKKMLQQELREGCYDMVTDFAEEQEENGACILDINVGMGGIDEMETMLQVMEEVSSVTKLPLCLDSSSVEVMEAALRKYPGRALVNSVSLEKEKFETLLPLVKKYGAMFILLPLSDKGLPESLKEKKEIIDTIVKRALELGMSPEDIVVDGLVTTVGANKTAALEALETIRYCKEKGLATICGLSNVSFGLPQRSHVNTAFLTMAIKEGLTMAIANPSQELLVCSAFASDLLLNKDGADLAYINRMSEDTVQSEQQDTWNSRLKNAVMKGNQSGIKELTRQALAEGENAKILLDEALLPAINEVGELFDKGKYFLPQLIAGAEAMKQSIEVLEPYLLSDEKQDNMPTVVVATVEGDIHDIGKNLVVLMLKNHGFDVIDLGKDVTKETIVQTAKERDAKVIALSALMTTTMRQMKEVIDYAKTQNLQAKIMVGGAVITEEYAAEIGADGYAKDAAGAVRIIRQILDLN